VTEPAFKVYSFGNEAEPVVVIDNFSSDAGALLSAAKAASYGSAGRHYPGHRASAPADYLKARSEVLGAVLGDVFGYRRGADLIECNYSVVTTPPQELTPIQRLPHFDGADSGKLALLHYLCPPEAGGTAFYRHRATGFEKITRARLAAYDAALRAEIAETGLPPAAYFAGSNAQFERIGEVAAAFNRMVIYRGITLHSGDILQPERIGHGIETARITLNTFLSAR
jgi:hypothetical protein